MLAKTIVWSFLATLTAFVSSINGASPVVIATTTTSISVVTTTTEAPLVSSLDMQKWTLVAQCETHQHWHRVGYVYDGGLGIKPDNWVTYGGARFSKYPHLATPEQQVWVAKQIETRHGIGWFVPDQNGECHAW